MRRQTNAQARSHAGTQAAAVALGHSLWKGGIPEELRANTAVRSSGRGPRGTGEPLGKDRTAAAERQTESAFEAAQAMHTKPKSKPSRNVHPV